MFNNVKKLQVALPVELEIPVFDLVAMGLPNVPVDGTAVETIVDCSDLIAAAKEGPIRVRLSIAKGVVTDTDAEITLNSITFCENDYYGLCTTVLSIPDVDPVIFTIELTSDGIRAWISEFKWFDVIVDMSVATSPTLLIPFSNDAIRSAIDAGKDIRYKIITGKSADGDTYVIGYGYSFNLSEDIDISYYEIGGYKLGCNSADDHTIKEYFYADTETTYRVYGRIDENGCLCISGVGKSTFLDDFVVGDTVRIYDDDGSLGDDLLFTVNNIAYMNESDYLVTLEAPDGTLYDETMGSLAFDVS